MALYDPSKLLLIAGPCALESEKLCLEIAATLVSVGREFPDLTVVFKGSFDKANRTSIHSRRGPGLEKGSEILATIKKDFGLPVLTDFHLPEQARHLATVVDVLQVPAFLCRQTDLLVAAAKTGLVVNVKKGQFLSPFEMKHVVTKLEESGAAEIWQTERGTTFGYQNLVVDYRNFDLLKAYRHPVVFDATHSVQLPGGGSGTTSGQGEFIPLLVRAAMAAGASGLFVETHPEPEDAISDGPNQVRLDRLRSLIEQALTVWKASKPWNTL